MLYDTTRLDFGEVREFLNEKIKSKDQACFNGNWDDECTSWAKKVALPHCQYIAKLDKFAKDSDQVVAHSYGNMPDWAKDNPALFGKWLIYMSVRMDQHTVSISWHYLES